MTNRGLTDVDTNLLRLAIQSENTWALDSEMPGVVGNAKVSLPPARERRHVVFPRRGSQLFR